MVHISAAKMSQRTATVQVLHASMYAIAMTLPQGRYPYGTEMPWITKDCVHCCIRCIQVSFLYDPEVFSSGIAFEPDTIIHRIRELAFLNSRAAIGLHITGTGKSSSNRRRKATENDSSSDGNGRVAGVTEPSSLGGADPQYLADLAQIDAAIAAGGGGGGGAASTSKASSSSSSRAQKARRSTAVKAAAAGGDDVVAAEAGREGAGEAAAGADGGKGSKKAGAAGGRGAASPGSGEAINGPNGLQVFYFQGGLHEYVQW